MAERLGTAELLLTANTAPLQAGLQQARQEAVRTGSEVEQAFTRTGKPLQTAANGMQYFVDASGRARNATGQFLTVAELQAAGLEKLATATQGASGKTGFFASQMDDLIQNVTRLGAALTITQAALYTFGQIREADQAAAAVRTLGVDSEELRGKLSALSNELDANVSTLDLLKASYDVASSGFADAASATEILRAASLGAKGGFADVNVVAKATTAVLNAYGLQAKDATRIVDGFVQAQADGVLTVAQYADNIGEIVSVGAAAGVSIEELNAAVATATLKGVQVNQAFTGFRQVLSSVLKPSKEASDLAAELGIDFSLAGLKAKGFAGFLADVAQKSGASADKVAVLLGSVEAQAALQPLLNDQLATYNKLLGNQATALGQSAKATDTSANTISGSISKIQNRLSNLAVTLDKGYLPAVNRALGPTEKLLGVLDKIAAAANRVSGLPQVGVTGNGAAEKAISSATEFGKILTKIFSGPTGLAEAANDAFSLTGNSIDEIGRKVEQAFEGAKQKVKETKEEAAGLRFAPDPQANAALWVNLAASQKEAAANAEKLGQQLATAQKAAADRLKEAADRVRSAAQALTGARQGFAQAVSSSFAIATNAQRQQARAILEQQIRAAERAGQFDPSRVASRYAIPMGEQGLEIQRLNFRQLERLAGEVGSLANAENDLRSATIENTAALKALANRKWEVQVQVNQGANGATTVNTLNNMR